MSISKRNIIIAGIAAVPIFSIVVAVVVISESSTGPVFRQCQGPSYPFHEITISSCTHSAKAGYCQINGEHPTFINSTFTPGKSRWNFSHSSRTTRNELSLLNPSSNKSNHLRTELVPLKARDYEYADIEIDMVRPKNSLSYHSFACDSGLECPGKAGQLQTLSMRLDPETLDSGEYEVQFKINLGSEGGMDLTYCIEFLAKVTWMLSIGRILSKSFQSDQSGH